ncbi:MAG: hypothetical protein PHP25_03750 [Candidatus Moranbacteria bacterium]|nr:hypothetical protein [Candidatus Moranbacteria bacterium]
MADVPCNGEGESCGSSCETGYTNIGYCANSFGFLGTKLICCKKGAPSDTPTIKSELGTSTTPESPAVPASSSAAQTNPGASTPPATQNTNVAPTPTPAQAQALAQSTADTSNSLVPCTDNCNLCDIIVGLNRIFKYLGTLLIIVATLFIIIAGIAYMVSGGSKSLMEWAKKALTYALIGFVLYLASWLIVGSILSAMGYNRTSWSTFDCQSGS